MNNISKRLKNIIEKLSKKYPNPQTPLIHKNIYELTVAVILSAQMTDSRLNNIIPTLFKKYPTFEALSKAKQTEVEKTLSGVNYYKTKTKHIIKTAKMVVENKDGEIPTEINELIKLPGIGRKSANVILNEGLNISQGIVVDTHVIRVSNRLGLTNKKDPVKIEQDLIKKIPKNYWREISLWFIFHGRETCIARNPQCNNCIINNYCKYFVNLQS